MNNSLPNIVTSAIIEGIRARKDRSLGLSITTPELTSPEKALFMELQGVNVALTIHPEGSDAINYKIEHDLEIKAPSVRMRNVFFILWKQNSEELAFQQYYEKKMEALIEKLKTRIKE